MQELRESWTEASQQAEYKGALYDLRQVAEEVPSFGGLSVIPVEGGPDTLVIRLVDPDTLAAEKARRAYIEQVSKGREYVSPSVERMRDQPLKIVTSHYNLVQLYNWFRLIGHYVMPIPLVNGSGINAGGINIWISEDSDNAVWCVERRLNELSIPRDAVQMKVVVIQQT